MGGIRFVAKVWKPGSTTSLVITIPANVVDFLSLSPGDMLELEIKRIRKGGGKDGETRG